jgi:type IV pilus assembly protein PilA
MNCTFLKIAKRRRASDRSTSAGFTLMELLIVISIIVILMLIAIPTSRTIKKKANELSAQKSLQTIEQGESCVRRPTRERLRMHVAGARRRPHSAAKPSRRTGVNELATGVKDGYIFSIGNCTVTVNNTDRITSFTIAAVPATPGKTGDRGFCLDSGGAES